MSELGNDLFDDEERVGGLLKSLISTKGLQTNWQSVAKRLQSLEQRLRLFQQKIDNLPEHFVKREEYNDLVETRHAKLLTEHERLMKESRNVVQKLSNTIEKKHSVQLRECLAGLEVQNALETRVQAKLDNVEKLAQDLRADVMETMHTSSTKLHNLLDEFAANAEKLKKEVEDGHAAAAQSIRNAEENMQISTQQKIDKMIQNLCYNQSSPEAAQLLGFVSKLLVNPLSVEVRRTTAEVEILTKSFAKQEELSEYIQRSQDKAMSELSAKLQETNNELKEQVGLCTKKVDSDRTSQELTRHLGHLSKENDDLRLKVVSKLKDFVEHIEKMHVGMQDHEHALRHHAEEIENRSTKYDLLICRNQVDKCASKDEFNREFGELKKIVNWQSGKIENFGLNMGGVMRPRKHLRRNRSKLHSRRSSNADGESSSEASYGGHSSVANGPTTMLRQKHIAEPEETVQLQPVLGNVEEADEIIADAEESDPQRDASSRASVGDSDDDSSSEHSVSSSTLVLRQQLEAVAMGMVGLAHLALKEVRLGTSRNARLAQEKEMLEELANVRHWITNRVVPSGWDPSKITTVALRCTHPREDELKGPSPQVSLKSLLELGDDSRMLPKRSLPGDPRATARAPGDPGGHTPNQQPLSARGLPGATSLPPLKGLVAG